ncbi:MAG TPA: hypothetical protein VFQ44_02325 [Streptosporangiaceae bacterium]|nr:hypothetical protein [Streptosporangiaceae bacterium]
MADRVPQPHVISRLLRSAGFTRAIERYSRSGVELERVPGFRVRSHPNPVTFSKDVIVTWWPAADGGQHLMTGVEMLAKYARAIEAKGWIVKTRHHELWVYPESVLTRESITGRPR